MRRYDLRKTLSISIYLILLIIIVLTLSCSNVNNQYSYPCSYSTAYRRYYSCLAGSCVGHLVWRSPLFAAQ